MLIHSPVVYNLKHRKEPSPREGEGLRVPKTWRLLPHDAAGIEQLSRGLKISPALAQLLLNRGVHDCEQARRFLLAPLSGLHDPALLPGVVEAARRLHQAVRDGKRICVYGDYDVDGITGTTILWRCLQRVGAAVDYYIPHRLEEGYGLNAEALRTLAAQGTQVVVTVDCGIGSLADADEARRLGLELIVTDHHHIGDRLPDACVVVHPKLPGGSYPFPDLCGAGVAFKLAWAVCQEFSQAKRVTESLRQFLLESVALVAMGSVADVVPLLDEARVFVKYGLKSLKEAPSLGLKALMQASGLMEKNRLEAADIGFNLAPRINAVGRLGQARLAVELLATPSEPRAADLARYLNDQNQLRQQIERRIYREACELAETQHNLQEDAALVLASADWHAGVIGIVAGRLVERYARPTLMISLKEDVGQGSGRSPDGFNLHEALQACREHLSGHGGHAKAAGFKIPRQNVDRFRQQFCDYAARRLNGRPRNHILTIDAETPLVALTLGLMRGIHYLEPHGIGNPRPLFLTGGLQIAGEPKKVGNGERHLSFRVRQESLTMKAIGFGMADRLEELMSQGGQCCLVYTPRINEYPPNSGQVHIDLEVADFQPGPRAMLLLAGRFFS